MLAMSLGVLWGFAGILSFGQAAFFALGAYAMGLAAQWGIGGNPAYAGLAASVIIGAGLATLIGYFLFSVGVRDLFFVLVTLALSIMVEQITVSQSQITGGYNGMFVPRMSLSFGGGMSSIFQATLRSTISCFRSSPRSIFCSAGCSSVHLERCWSGFGRMRRG
jgi:ABC-type branched-subunit amino acid transport system permease subunit